MAESNLYLGWSLILGPIVLGGWHKSPAKGFALIVAFYATLIIHNDRDGFGVCGRQSLRTALPENPDRPVPRLRWPGWDSISSG